MEEPCLHVKRFLERLVVDLKLIICDFILCVSITVASICRYKVAICALFRVLLTAHKDHMFQEVRQTLPVPWIVVTSNVKGKRAVSHTALDRCGNLIIVLDE